MHALLFDSITQKSPYFSNCIILLYTLIIEIEREKEHEDYNNKRKSQKKRCDSIDTARNVSKIRNLP